MSRERRAQSRFSALSLSLWFACLPLLGSCAPQRAQEGWRTRMGVLRIGLPTDVPSLDPANAYDTTSWPLVHLVCEGLLDYGDGADLQPLLAAEMPRISPDGRVYSIRLRPRVRYSNGREVVAEDFVYSLERILDPLTKSKGEGFFRGIAGARGFQTARETEAAQASREERQRRGRWIEPTRVSGLRALDRYTLEIRLEQPDLAFLNVLAMPFAAAVPREAVVAAGEDFYLQPVGTGPFVLAEWRRGTNLRFERNPFYFRREEVRLRGLEVLVGVDPLVQQMMFERGELDIVPEIATPDFVRVMGDPRLHPLVRSIPRNATVYLTLNTEMPPFNDPRVRRAMNHAANRERILTLLNGRGIVARGVLPPLMPGHNPNLKSYPFDPVMARRLLAEAGYANGFDLPIWAQVDRPQDVKIVQAIQQDYRAVGIRVELNTVAFAVFEEKVGRRGAVKCAVFGWYQDYPDPSNFLTVLLRGDRIVPDHCNNAAFYSNPEVDRILREADRATDPAARLRLYQRAEVIVVEDAPWVFLYHPIDYTLHQPWIQGYSMHPVWTHRYERFWFAPPSSHHGATETAALFTFHFSLCNPPLFVTRGSPAQ